MKNLVTVFKAFIVFGIVFSSGSVSAQWLTNGSNIYNSNSGNIGIGFNSPTAKLHIKRYSTLGSSSLNGFQVERSVYIWPGGSNTYTDFVVNGSGRVGIGTTNIPSSYKMAVDGMIICEGVRVSNSTIWPDYVFEENYSLKSLDEVADFIEDHKHLPGIPSAGEIDAAGFDLGEMDAKLLQKIEELTLYMIGLNEKVTCLEKENSRLKNCQNK